MHVTLRVVPEVGRLRRRDCYLAVRRAMITSLRRVDSFRICEVSIQSNHLHLIVEAADRAALSTGMKGFQVSAAKQLNAALGKRTGVRRRGRVFADRYHDEPLTSPTQVRNALGYVVNNWRRHREDRQSPQLQLDPYSSARTFTGFRERRDLLWIDADDEILPVAFATTWLLREGWRKLGLLSVAQVPGPRH